MILKYPCVCCGRLTRDEPPGSHLICPVCFWEDDILQLRWPDWAVGANRIALVEAQENYQAFGACDERSVEHVRPPLEDEPQDRSRRPIDLEYDRFEPQGVELAAWPDDATVLYWWRYRNTGFWRPAAGRSLHA
ncbi:CPCC family cysteine-rich protein [Streptomyces yangpuensis]|uniref:CPCC family cysteine-rich protein n=1 Tax=Streptomyces yangpuensis TaxID=1648182 RepID=UPI003809CE89